MQTLGKYRIVKELGHGGFGTVYLVEDTTLDNRPVALKVLHPQLLVDPDTMQLFGKEAGVTARLVHHHIVTVYEAGDIGGTRFIAMQYVPGQSLQGVMQEEGPQPLVRVAEWLEQIASALDYAHGEGVLHRDIKPSNILLDRDGRAMVSDFGLAKAVQNSGGSVSSRDKEIMTGTAKYMAPEQAKGKPVPQSDIYSLGVVLYELLTGKVPFEGDDPFAIAIRHMTEEPVSPREHRPDLPEPVEAVVLKAMAKQPTARFVSAGKMAVAFRMALEAEAKAREQAREREKERDLEAMRRRHESELAEAKRRAEEAEADRHREEAERRKRESVAVGESGVSPSSPSRTVYKWQWGVVGLVAIISVIIGATWAIRSCRLEPLEVAEATVTPAIVQESVPSIATPSGSQLLVVDVLPYGATVRLDGVEQGQSPITLMRPLGVYQFLIEYEGFAPLETIVTLEPGGEAVIAGMLTDITAPQMTVTLSPAEIAAGQTVDIAIEAVDNVGVTRLEVFLDGELLNDEKLASQTVTGTLHVAWTPEEPGLYHLLGRVGDAGGNTAEEELMITVRQAPSRTPAPLPGCASPASCLSTDEMQVMGEGWISKVAYSPDGQTLVIATSLGVELRDSKTSAMRLFIPTTACVTSVAFSPDGMLLATGSFDHIVRLWRVSDGAFLRRLEGHTDRVLSVAFSPDGAVLASAAADSVARLWRVSDGTLLHTLGEHTDTVFDVAFSPDGVVLASGSWDNTVRLWRVTDGTLLRTLEGHASGVYSVAFSPDGTKLASGGCAARDGNWVCLRGQIRVWQMADGALLQTLQGHTADVLSLAFSPNGATLASASYDKTVRLWLVGDSTFPRTLEGHTGGVYSVAFSLDGTTLASASMDGTVRLWQVADGILLYTLEGHTAPVTSVAFTPSGETLASGMEEHNAVWLWQVADGSLLQTLRGHTNDVYSVAFSPDGLMLASGAWDNTVRLWRTVDGALIRTLEGHTGWVRGVAFSADGTLLASGSRDRTVSLWRIADGTLVLSLEGHTDEVMSVVFSPTGSTLASASMDSTVRLWNVADGNLLRVLQGHTCVVTSVAFSPDGMTLISGSGDDTVRLWRVADGALLHTIEGHTDLVTSVTFSADGEMVASGSWDETVRLWRIPDGAPVRTLTGHTGVVSDVTFSPDGKWLASGSEDGTVRLWSTGD